MNGIIGLTELALDTPLDPEPRDYLLNVQQAAESLLTIVDDILDFSKIEAGKLRLEHIDFSVSGVIAEACKMLALRAHQKGLALYFDVDERTPAVVRGDPGRLRQVLVNLIGNAIKFTEQGEIEVRCMVRQIEGARCVLAITVRDTGVGIAADKLETIFGAFSQADTSTTRKYGGTGLGLAICRRLVEMMGGGIGVESVPGQGSRFVFTLHADSVSAARPRRPAELGGRRVLVAEVNPALADHLSRSLTALGMRAEVVGDGEALLASLSAARGGQDPYDFLLLDGVMPSPGGLALAARFAGVTRLLDRLIMMLPTHTQRSDVRRCKELGLEHRLIKPFSMDDLIDVLAAALGVSTDEELITLEPFDLGDGQAPDGELEPLSILLVEDNPVNQTVATRILEKAGHRVTLAENGEEALECFDAQRFDLILMDVQMPVMGGIEATQAIRLRETHRSWVMAGEGWRHTPIIAMTAHALESDKARCLEAGMDGYVSKPVRADALFAAIARVLDEEGRQQRGAPAEELPRLVEPDDAQLAVAIDLREAEQLLDGDDEGLRQLIELFLRDQGGQLNAMRAAAAAGDHARLGDLAHTLKGTLGVFGAEPAIAAARQLEKATRAGRSADVARELAGFLGEFNRVVEALQSHRPPSV